MAESQTAQESISCQYGQGIRGYDLILFKAWWRKQPIFTRGMEYCSIRIALPITCNREVSKAEKLVGL